MATKVSNLYDVMHRVASSCLLYPVAQAREPREEEIPEKPLEDEQQEVKLEKEKKRETIEEEEKEKEGFRVLKEAEKEIRRDDGVLERVREMEDLMEEFFEAVSAVKTAYVRLQEAHCPWDPERIRLADVAVVAELRRLGTLRERFRRGRRGGKRSGPYRWAATAAVVGPYEAALEEVKREMRAKEAEVEGLKEKLRNASNGRIHPSHRRVKCITQGMEDNGWMDEALKPISFSLYFIFIYFCLKANK